MNILTRRDAKKLGLKRCFLGRPCVRGHMAERWVCNNACIACYAERDKRRDMLPEVKKRKRRTAKIYRKENYDKIRFAINRWVRENPEAARVLWRRRHARKRNAKGSHTALNIIALFNKQKGKCANFRCNKLLTLGYHVDHKTPLSRGGSNGPRNLQLLCAACNIRKVTKTIKEWARAG